jgi:hypothetical protein
MKIMIMMKKKPKKKNKSLYVSKNNNRKLKFFLFDYQDEFFAPVPTEIVERLVTRPEDMKPDVADSIQLFKNQLLRIFEVK